MEPKLSYTTPNPPRIDIQPPKKDIIKPKKEKKAPKIKAAIPLIAAAVPLVASAIPKIKNAIPKIKIEKREKTVAKPAPNACGCGQHIAPRTTTTVSKCSQCGCVIQCECVIRPK